MSRPRTPPPARVLAGDRVRQFGPDAAPALQRQTPAAATGEKGEEKPEEKKEPGEVAVEGLKTVVEQAKDENPKVKKFVIEPLKQHFKGEWGRLGAGERSVSPASAWAYWA